MSAEPILHVDIDSFYASVEVLKDPSLAGKPVVVGGPGARGVVASASYEARKYGVRSAMPAVRARRLCPDIVFLPSDFEAYRAHSHRFREVLCSYTPLVEPISLDEAFLDVGGATMLFGSSAEIAAKIRADVEREVGVTCSVGVAPSKFVAKLASDDCKPNGMLVVPAGGVRDFLEPLPVGRLWGVGEKTGETLGRLGIRTIGDLGRTPESILERLLGHASAHHLSQLAHGVDDRGVVPYEAPKSVSHEETFDRDLDADEDILRELLDLSGRVRGATACRRVPCPDGRLESSSGELPDPHPIPDALRRLGCRRGSVPDRGRALRRASRSTTADPSARSAGERPGPGGRGATRHAARRALGRRRARARSDRAAVRSRRGASGLVDRAGSEELSEHVRSRLRSIV